MSIFVHHVKAIDESKLELQSGSAVFGSKSAIFCLVWPWNLKDDLEEKIWHLFDAASNFVNHFIVISEFKLDWRSVHAQFGSKSMIFFLSCVTLKYDDDLEKQ